jgi:hypothetical protein
VTKTRTPTLEHRYYSAFEAFGSLKNTWSYGYPWKKGTAKMKVDLHSALKTLESPDGKPTEGYYYGMYDPRTKVHRCYAPSSALATTTWGGLEIRVPTPIEPFLVSFYGTEWRKPYKGWVWNREPFTIGSCVRS